MSIATDACLLRWVAIRRRVTAMLSGSSSLIDTQASTPGEAGGLLAAFLTGLRASPAYALASARERQRILVDMLRASGGDVPSSLRPFAPAPDYASQFDDGFEGLIGAGYLRGVRSRDAEEISVTGLAGVPLSAEAVVFITESVLTSVRQRPERPVLLALDEGTSVVDMDESRPLSEYLVHLARVLAWARSQAVAVNLWLCGGVTAASYAACSASAARVVAFPNAVLLTESPAQAEGDDAVSSRQWAFVGLVDECADVGRRVGIAWNAWA